MKEDHDDQHILSENTEKVTPKLVLGAYGKWGKFLGSQLVLQVACSFVIAAVIGLWALF